MDTYRIGYIHMCSGGTVRPEVRESNWIRKVSKIHNNIEWVYPSSVVTTPKCAETVIKSNYPSQPQNSSSQVQ